VCRRCAVYGDSRTRYVVGMVEVKKGPVYVLGFPTVVVHICLVCQHQKTWAVDGEEDIPICT
jgi:hypothetical protein